MTYRATKLDPPRINESPEQLFKWRQRVFELLNGINTILADGIEISPTGQITGTNLQDAVEQVDAIITLLQLNLATTVASETTFGISPDVGISVVFAREDHTHGSPSDPVVAHLAAADPHTQYHNDTRGDIRYYTKSQMDALLAMAGGYAREFMLMGA